MKRKNILFIFFKQRFAYSTNLHIYKNNRNGLRDIIINKNLDYFLITY